MGGKLSKKKGRASEDAADLEYASTCVIPTTPKGFALLEKRDYNHDSTIYAFEVPGGKSLSLPTCACILAIAPGAGEGGADVCRPYTRACAPTAPSRAPLPLSLTAA